MSKFKYDNLTFSSNLTPCMCPDCQKQHRQYIEQEHLDSPFAWKALFGMPVILCSNCRKNNYKEVKVNEWND